MARAGISLQSDFSELAVATGAVNGMAKKLRTNRFAADLVKYAHSRMADSFDAFMELQFGEDNKALHHVFEWNTPPEAPNAKLWKHKTLGGGANINATWDWRASKKPIPSIQERAANPNDPMYHVPADELEFLSKERHWFHWKAPVMEANTPVIILPRRTKFLVFPTGDPSQPLRWARSVEVNSPGGDATTGAFTTRWVGWWANEAPRIFEEAIAPEAEREIANSVRKASRARTTTIGISTMADYKKLMKSGEDWVEANIERYQRRWRLGERRRGR